jgi:TPR repeat protein
MATSVAPASEKRQFLNHSYARASKALRLAEKGDAVSEYEFALMCEKGDGLAQNHAEAVKWFRLSAAQDYGPAQLFLGLMYASGEGVAKDYREALKWLHLAAEQDNATAQFYLGRVYFDNSARPNMCKHTNGLPWLDGTTQGV